MAFYDRLSWLLLFTLVSTVFAWGVAVDSTPIGEEHLGKRTYGSKTVRKTLKVTWEPGSPTGVDREIIKVNGQFPSPNLIFDEGDDVEITVYNYMPFNTTVHWHGLEMVGTPWSDGVPGLGQKPIEPGSSYVYRFKASPAGTYWYHSHTRATLLDGLYGGIFIRPKPSSPAPWSLISNNQRDQRSMAKAAIDPILVVGSDWNNFTSWDYLKAEEDSNLDIFCRDGVLINGKGSIFCPGIDYVQKYAPPDLVAAFEGQNVNDKGCLPFVYNTEGPYLAGGNISRIPYGLQTPCIAANGSVEVIEVDASQGWVSINFVMAATFMLITPSIDSHDMWIYEVDGRYVEPQRVQAVIMYPGERYAAMVKLDQKPGDYIIRAPSALAQVSSGFAVLRYKNSRHPPTLKPGVIPSSDIPGAHIDYGGFNTSANSIVLDGAYTHFKPFPPLAPAQKADETYIFKMGRMFTPWQWTFTGTALMPVDADAYAPLLYAPNSPPAMNPDLVIRTKNGSWVDLVLLVGHLPNEPAEISHAIHKHASKVWLVGSGQGNWTYKDTAEAMRAEPQNFNFVDPSYRDTFVTTFSGAAWFVLRYQVTNPGPWLLHCHVETHLAGGMGVVIMDGVDKWPTIPPQYAVDQHGFMPLKHYG